MSTITIYRWCRGHRALDADGGAGPWEESERLYCSEPWMRYKTQSEEELGFWSALGDTPRVTTDSSGVTTFACDSPDRTLRLEETFEPVTLTVADHIANAVRDIVETSRCLAYETIDGTDTIVVDAGASKVRLQVV